MERVSWAPKRIAAPKRFMFFFCGRGKLGGGYNRLLCNESFESCLTEQRCSVDLLFFYVLFCFVNCQGCAFRIK